MLMQLPLSAVDWLETTMNYERRTNRPAYFLGGDQRGSAVCCKRSSLRAPNTRPRSRRRSSWSAPFSRRFDRMIAVASRRTDGNIEERVESKSSREIDCTSPTVWKFSEQKRIDCDKWQIGLILTRDEAMDFFWSDRVEVELVTLADGEASCISPVGGLWSTLIIIPSVDGDKLQMKWSSKTELLLD